MNRSSRNWRIWWEGLKCICSLTGWMGRRPPACAEPRLRAGQAPGHRDAGKAQRAHHAGHDRSGRSQRSSNRRRGGIGDATPEHPRHQFSTGGLFRQGVPWPRPGRARATLTGRPEKNRSTNCRALHHKARRPSRQPIFCLRRRCAGGSRRKGAMTITLPMVIAS